MLKSATIDVEAIVAIDRPRTGRAVDAWYAALKHRERLLWAAVVAALLGDFALTAYGLGAGLAESNPVVRSALATGGFAAFAGVKLLAVGAAALARRVSPEHGPAIALGLLLPWGFAAINNAVAIAFV